MGSWVTELLTIASFFGMVGFAAHQFAIKMEDALLWVVAVVTGLLFAASFTPAYGLVVWVIWGVGLGLLGVVAIRSARTFAHPGFWGPLVALLILSVLLSQSRLIHYDNFSHWALTTKIITVRLRLPIEADQLITHSAYPLGTALFSSFMTITSGMKDSMLIRANVVMYLASLAVFFRLRSKHVGLVLVSVTAGSIWAVALRISPSDLLVDMLLAFVFLAAWVMVIHEENVKNSWMTLMPILFFLTMMKSTGFMMAVVLGGIFWWRWVNQKQKGSLRPLWVLIVPLVTQFLIGLSASLRYTDVITSKHAFTVEWLSEMMALKSADQIRTIVMALADAWMSDTFVVALMVTYGVILVVLWRKRAFRWPVVLRWLTPLLTYMIYQSGILLMYLYSMPIGEAVRLAGYFRYRSTGVAIMVFMVLFDLITDVQLNSTSHKSRQSWMVMAALIAMVYIAQPVNAWGWLRKDYTTAAIVKFERLVQNQPISASDQILIYVTPEDAQYVTLVARYYFLSPTIKYLTRETLETFSDWAMFDVLVVYDPDDYIGRWLSQCLNLDEPRAVIPLNTTIPTACIQP